MASVTAPAAFPCGTGVTWCYRCRGGRLDGTCMAGPGVPLVGQPFDRGSEFGTKTDITSWRSAGAYFGKHSSSPAVPPGPSPMDNLAGGLTSTLYPSRLHGAEQLRFGGAGLQRERDGERRNGGADSFVRYRCNFAGDTCRIPVVYTPQESLGSWRGDQQAETWTHKSAAGGRLR